ncbi:MAG: DUF4286 family protein [Gammaproteobacteria bacterium]
MTIIYEVTLQIAPDIAAEYDAWLAAHAAEMLTLPDFLSAEISTIESNEERPARVGRVVHYRLKNREALDGYFRNHAARLRDAGIARFGERVSASRRILHPTKTR